MFTIHNLYEKPSAKDVLRFDKAIRKLHSLKCLFINGWCCDGEKWVSGLRCVENKGKKEVETVYIALDDIPYNIMWYDVRYVTDRHFNVVTPIEHHIVLF